MARSKGIVGRWGRRLPVQFAGLVAFNAYFFANIGKRFCIPVLNCYSCPIGTVACPIGSITAFALMRRIPYYIIGTLGLIALAVGRAFCGWACPFGLLQDGLYRIKSYKWRMPRAADGLKYVLLAALVVGLPLILGGGKLSGASDRIVAEGTGAYDYCSLVCPAGMLEGGVPALARSSEIRADMSWRTWSKLGILVGVIGLAVVSRRGFCRALCPLGALMALGSKVSLLNLHTDENACTKCMRCVKVCSTNARRLPFDKKKIEATAECVLCLDCVRNCPEKGALSARFGGRPFVVSKDRSND
jgi:ferredoxin-type protein NapH